MSDDAAIWDWAVAAYARPGVAEACLALQNQHGQSVCFLLWAAWAGAEGEALASAAATARRWEADVLEQLRELRRRLKTADLPGGSDDVRDALKCAELRAERKLLETLPGAGPRREAASTLGSLRAAAAAWGRAAPEPALAALARALG